MSCLDKLFVTNVMLHHFKKLIVSFEIISFLSSTKQNTAELFMTLHVPRNKRNKPIITNIKSLTFETDKCIDFMQNIT